MMSIELIYKALSLSIFLPTGARIIILNCQGVYGSHVLRQAHLLGLMSEGWAWILTSGITSSVCILLIVS